MPQKNLVWLASYPKSGNTWTRIFLANYLFNAQVPIPINQVHRLGVGDSVAEFYRRTAGGAFDPCDIRATLALRPRVLRRVVANGADVNFVKTHLPRQVMAGIELVPPQMTRAAVYILRNPLDMVLSYARHYALPLERAVLSIGRSDNVALGQDGMTAQPLGNWSAHVRSWTRKGTFPVEVIRYEDLKAEPAACFTRILDLIGVPVDEERLERAIRFSSFEEMQRQEAAHGFVEKARRAEKFFVSGESGRGRTELPAELIDRIETEHKDAMQRFGYL